MRAVAAPLAEGPFGVATERFVDITASELAEFQASVGELVSGDIAAAAEFLATYLEGPYAAAALEGVGASQWPDGEEYYRFATRRSTTMEVTPEGMVKVDPASKVTVLPDGTVKPRRRSPLASASW